MHIARMHISLYVRQRMYNSESMLPIGQVFFIASSKSLCAFFQLRQVGATINFHLAKVQRWRKKSTTNQLKYHSNSCINFVLLNNSILSRCRGQANRNKFIRKWSVNRLYLFDGALNCGMWILVCCLRLRWRRRTTIWQHQTAITVTTFFLLACMKKMQNIQHDVWQRKTKFF